MPPSPRTFLYFRLLLDAISLYLATWFTINFLSRVFVNVYLLYTIDLLKAVGKPAMHAFCEHGPTLCPSMGISV